MPTEITSLANGYTYSSEVAKADSMPVPAVEKESNARSEQPKLNVESLSRLEDAVQVVHRNLEFRVDDETGKQVIRVIDSGTGKLIRQIPPEQILNMISQLQDSLDDMVSGVLLDDRA